ncbi:CD59 glycoprotein-like [Triplophysa dalaica]|uniref:CD59 glycoprotein-like n=1 Tax=Triplophysa dalaica TaxID=1582913 RepID=UPI0024DFD7DC|nr:CD59 glycoprotein-like [Triplophysa dalaica]
MKTLVVLVFALTLLGLGSALKCYTAYSQVIETQDCSTEDACLAVYTEGSFHKGKCLKYADCDLEKVRQMFPGIANMKFRCCTTSLCNAASLSVASNSLVGLLLSVALFSWCFL